MSYPPSEHRPGTPPPAGLRGTGESPGAQVARERTARSQALANAVQLAAHSDFLVTAAALWAYVAEFERYLLSGHNPAAPTTYAPGPIIQEGP
jgi:hypothetical protein